MNIAPYLIARSNDWQFPDGDEIVRTGFQIVDNNPFLFGILRLLPGLRAVTSLEEDHETAELPVGLYTLALSSWQDATSELSSRSDGQVLSRRFVRGIVHEQFGRILLFPDDPQPEPNISFFSPTLEENRDVVLRSIEFLAQQDGRGFRVVSSNNGCTTAVSGRLRSRIFYCYQTGCRHRCKQGVRVERNAVNTIICEC